MKRIAINVVLFVGVLAGVARAEEYRLEGTHSTRGAFTADLEVSGEPATVVERLRWASGAEEVRRGTAARSGDRLEVRLVGEVGMTGALDPTAPRPEEVTLAITLAGDAVEARATDSQGERVARGKKAEARPSFADKAGKHLLALAKKELEKTARRGVKLDEEFKLGDYLHLGVGASIRSLAPEVLTAEQAAERTKLGRSAWIVSEVHGAPRVPYGWSMPLGDGGASVSVGFEVGARVKYEVTDLYPLPERFADADVLVADLRDLAVRSFDLPLTAEEALALTPGAKRVLDGEAAVAVSGALQIGQEVTKFGDDVVRIGATARLSGFWRVAGNLKIEVARLGGQAARVRVTRGTTSTRGGAAELLLGAAIDQAKLEAKLAPVVEYVDNGKLRAAVTGAVSSEVTRRATDVLRFQVGVSGSNTDSEQLDLSYRFDLSVASAREAYGRAVKGDLTLAGDQALEQGSGVTMEHRVLACEDVTYAQGDLVISVLLRAGFTKRVRFADLDVEDGAGKRRYEVFSFGRSRFLQIAGMERRGRVMGLDVIRSQTPDGAVARSLRWTLDVDDPTTTAADAAAFRRVLGSWGVGAEGGLDNPNREALRSAYGTTRSRMVVEVGEPGVAAMLAASEEQAVQAYADAYAALEGEVPEWATPQGRKWIRDQWSPSNDDERMKRLIEEVKRADEFAKGLTALARSGTPEERADKLRKLASAARYDLWAVTALLSLAPRDAVRLEASIRGERILIEGRHAGERAALVAVRDPR